jgi:hypothetical protein
MPLMGDVVSLSGWRAERDAVGAAAGERRRTDLGPGWHPSRGTAGLGVEALPGDEDSLRRLEGAVDQIDRVTSRVTMRGGRLSPDVETELLALLGQISLGLVPEAATRAERLAQTLGGAASSGP